MTDPIEPVRSQLAERYAEQLEACDGLRQFALDIRTPWGGRPLDDDMKHEAILVVISSRSLNTFWSAVELARIGFGQQAAMLNRSLFEDMIDAHWVTVEPDLAAQRLEEHHLHGRMLLADTVREDRLLPESDIPTFDAERRIALDKQFGAYGERSWTGLSLHQRGEAVKHLWGDEQGQEGLRFYCRIVHRENNQLLHVSAFSISSEVRARTSDALTLSLGPSEAHVGKALLSAFWTFGQTISLILDTFEFQLDEPWQEVYVDRLGSPEQGAER